MPDTDTMWKVVMGVFAIMLGAIIVSLIFGSKEKVDTKNKLDSGEYVMYYNGEEVDPEDIDIDLYNYSVDDDKHVVYITDKTESRHYPIVMPVIP